MNLRTVILLAIFAVAGSAAELSIGNGILRTAGQPATLNVALASTGATLSGIQFDIEYDAAALNVTVTAGPAVSSANKNLHSSVLQAGRQRVLIVGMNQNAIADGVVAVLQVSLKGRAEAGKTFPIRITTSAGTNAQAQAVAVSGGNGSVKVETNGNSK